jgi:2-polyprenyl-6-methoxyphenol hydroxylase-like FAD-dependent oxidoreductase
MTQGVDVAIAGGGPAGMMAGLLFARAGARTVVVEKHADFLRDFRGDTVHPSTLELMDQLGLLAEFLKRPHDEVRSLTARVADRRITVADLTHLPTKCRFVALMPQWDFLDFLADEARHYPTFDLRMETEAVDLIDEGGRIAGLRLKDGTALPARLTIAADGRGSILRDKAGLTKRDLGAPIDVLWFRLPKGRSRTRPAARSAPARSSSRSTGAITGNAPMSCPRARRTRSGRGASPPSAPMSPRRHRISPTSPIRCATGIR